MIPSEILAALSPGHRRLLMQEMPLIVQHVVGMWRNARLAPWQIGVLVLDLTSDFGNEAAMALVEDSGRVQRAVELGAMQGRLPALTLPLPLDTLLTLIADCAPNIHDRVVNRSGRSMPVIIVDADDVAVMVSVDRVPHAGSA
jgi:hypothetical protein